MTNVFLPVGVSRKTELVGGVGGVVLPSGAGQCSARQPLSGRE